MEVTIYELERKFELIFSTAFTHTGPKKIQVRCEVDRSIELIQRKELKRKLSAKSLCD